MDEADIAQIESDPCNCSESYDQTIYDHVIGNDTKKTISFMPPHYLVTGDVQTFFNLQVTFNYNSPQWLSNTSIRRDSPKFWLLVYDPAIPAQHAYETGTAGLTLIDANGFTAIILTPNYLRRRNLTPHYEYNADVNTTPFLDVACDNVSLSPSAAVVTNAADDNAYAPCYALMAFRFANLQRVTQTERQAVLWRDVLVGMGNYFALVQFVCWVCSGVAWSGAL